MEDKKYDKPFIEYNKLVRDKVPQIIKDYNKIPKYHKADDKTYFSELKKKLIEEAKEFDEEETIEELADALQVIYSICQFKNISKEDLEQTRLKLEKEKGSFKNKIILESVTKEKLDN